MLVRELINVLKNFPRKHIFTLFIGSVLIISISLLGSIKFTEEKQYSELTKSLSLSSLTDGYQIDIPPIEKERKLLNTRFFLLTSIQKIVNVYFARLRDRVFVFSVSIVFAELLQHIFLLNTHEAICGA